MNNKEIAKIIREQSADFPDAAYAGDKAGFHIDGMTLRCRRTKEAANNMALKFEKARKHATLMPSKRRYPGRRYDTRFFNDEVESGDVINAITYAELHGFTPVFSRLRNGLDEIVMTGLKHEIDADGFVIGRVVLERNSQGVATKISAYKPVNVDTGYSVHKCAHEKISGVKRLFDSKVRAECAAILKNMGAERGYQERAISRMRA